MFKRTFIAALLALASLAPLSTPAAAGCDATNHSFALAPYASRTFELCTWGSPHVSAVASGNVDIDGVLVNTWSGFTVDLDGDYTNVVWLGGYGFGAGTYRYTITNNSGRWTTVSVEESDL